MVIRLFLVLAFLFNILSASAQRPAPKNDVIRSGLFRSQLTIAPGVMLNSKLTNIYLHGGFEYFLGRKMSFVGQGYWFINSQQKNRFLKHNSSVLWGLRYHFPHRKFDTFLGLEPGIGFVQARQVGTEGNETVSLLKVTPLITATAGFTFYLGRFFNFFFETRYVHGQHSTAWSETYKLDEFRFSAGLGWNVNFLKKKS